MIIRYKLILIAFAISIILFLGLLKFSTTPHFCNSCHIMRPYYEGWKKSTHNNVPCIDCHYPPAGPKTMLWHKIQALSQVVKYITRTYGSKPYAEIEDASCLRRGCHEQRLLRGQVIFKGGVIFDHRPHLEEVRRGRELRCVSCHSQIVVGKHIEVTLDTCYLCHFKGMKEARVLHPLGGCSICHQIPEKDFIIGGITYNHKDFVTKHGAECQSCHFDVVQGEGTAKKDACYACHNQPEKLAKFEDIPFIHENHVTKHNVACFHCHEEIKHKVLTKSPLDYDCSMCHTDKHQGQKDMYMGIKGKGVADMPSPMFLAGVDCLACHLLPKEQEGKYEQFTGQTYKASEIGCLKCHGREYIGLVEKWKQELSSALKIVKERLNKIVPDIEALSSDREKYTQAKSLYSEAEYNFDFVRLSEGLHNIYYSAQLLQRANSNLEQIEGLSGNLPRQQAGEKLPSAGNSLLNGSYCATLCHGQLGVKIKETVVYKNKEMPHRAHTEMGLNCQECHTIGAHKDLKLKTDVDEFCITCHEI